MLNLVCQFFFNSFGIFPYAPFGLKTLKFNRNWLVESATEYPFVSLLPTHGFYLYFFIVISAVCLFRARMSFLFNVIFGIKV